MVSQLACGLIGGYAARGDVDFRFPRLKGDWREEAVDG